MDKFHVLYLYRWAKLTEVETKRIPIDTECCEWRPLVEVDNVLFECSAVDVKTNGVFDFSWYTNRLAEVAVVRDESAGEVLLVPASAYAMHMVSKQTVSNACLHIVDLWLGDFSMCFYLVYKTDGAWKVAVE
jgi:hypothetical protein